MSALPRALWGLGVAGLVGGLLAILLVLTSDTGGSAGHKDERWVVLVFAPVIGWSFIGTGLYAWARRPENRLGALMTAVGFTWLISSLTVSDSEELHTAGILVSALPYAVLAHMLLAFPEGRLHGRAEYAVLAVGYATVTVVHVAFLLFFDTTRPECGCPGNLLLVERNDDVADAIASLQSLMGLGALLATAYLIWRRWQRTTAAQRRAFTPVLIAGGLTIFSLLLSLAADLVGLDDDVEYVIDLVGISTMALVPVGFLVGLLRSRLSRAASVGALVERLAERRRGLRDALAEALGEPGLALAFRRDDGSYVDADGHAIDLPAVHTPVERDGRVVGALLHSRALAEEDAGALRTVAAAAGLALENERLEAELRARIEELRVSRARIVEASDAARRRIERNLHDGAQQRLVALALNLRLARARLASDPDEAAALLDESMDELGQATAELREIARGIHPAVLSDRGLAAALDALAGRAPLPVELEAVPQERLPAPVESAAYFLVAEALTNVARYARAEHASVRVDRTNGRVVVEVRDDGVGGADPAAGTGLRGLADRVAALDGRLEVVSPAGAGTTVRAEIPCGS